MWESNSYKAHEDHKKLYKALEKSMDRDQTNQLLTDLAEARRKKKRRHDSPKTPPGSPPHQPPPPLPPAGPSRTSRSSRSFGSSQLPPPPPPPSTNQIDQSKTTAAPSSSKTAASAKYTAWITIDTRLKLSVSSILEDLHMDDDSTPDKQVHSSDDEYIGNDHIPKFQMEECHKLLTDRVDDAIIRYNVSKPLPLGGQPGQVTIQTAFFFNKDLEYLRYGSKGGRHALSISKMKAAYYPDVGLEQMVPDQMWIEEECKYDIAAMYGISHWWFQRQRFYIDRHTSEGDRKAVRTHMRILSVVKIKVFSLYGYDYMKKIVLRRVDLKEHIIAKRDFKYLYPSDFEDLYLLNLQDSAKPRWDETGFEYKHEFIVIESPRAVTFRDKYGVQVIMRFNEIHKFNDGTLHQIDEALDYKVKEFKVNRINPSLNTQFWTRKDVKRRITELTQKDLEGPAFEVVKVFHLNVIHLQYQMEECHKLLTDKVDDTIIRYNVSKPLPLGGQPGKVTIQADFFFNKYLEYLRYGSKGGRPALSISKMKATCYPDVGLEQMVPGQMWIEEECKYDIAAMYGISHWWFQRQ
ncbi:hypothetical protein Tco_0629058 [Tanacetum coccineum]|uniref:Uncharacterized protein n=1 Tax=Tanacetum coccineum TaxID=301880 RepID=A0ABQ4WST9_9ASTR